MEASGEEARLLFGRWREASTAIRLQLFRSRVVFDGIGAVQVFNGTALEFGGDTWQITVPLSDAVFAFSDPHEITVASVREAEVARYEMGLSISLPSGDRVVLMELR